MSGASKFAWTANTANSDVPVIARVVQCCYSLPSLRRWEKDGRPLVATSLVRIFSSGRLLVRQSSTSDSGRYSCVAENGVGLAARVDCDVALMSMLGYLCTTSAVQTILGPVSTKC